MPWQPGGLINGIVEGPNDKEYCIVSWDESQHPLPIVPACRLVKREPAEIWCLEGILQLDSDIAAVSALLVCLMCLTSERFLCSCESLPGLEQATELPETCRPQLKKLLR